MERTTQKLRGERFTEEQLAYITENYKTEDIREMSKKINMPTSTIYHILLRRGISIRADRRTKVEKEYPNEDKKWSDEDDIELALHYRKSTTMAIADKLGRRRESIRQRAIELGYETERAKRK